MTDPHLPSWRDTDTIARIRAFVESVTTGPDAVPASQRVAVFDNDGTLWSEKPMPTQLHYLVEQWQQRLKADPSLADQQPYTAIAAGELSWLGTAVDKHYAGDDADMNTLLGAIVGLVGEVSVETYAASVAEFYETARHPTLGTPYSHTVYQPMVELLRYLEANDFTCYIVSGGERDFMRPMTEGYYGIPPERVVGTAFDLKWDEASGEVRYSPALSFFDDGPEKPPRIWSRIGQRPILAVGNSNGDVPMLEYAAGGGRGLAMLISHDDDTERGDTPYSKGAERALEVAAERGYAVVSVKDDWDAVFPAS